MKRVLILFSLLLTFSACREVPIQHDLNEKDANEILVLFYHHGIKAEKIKEEKNQEISWNISVDPDDEPAARELLVENNLPRELSLGLGGVCKDEGLIPTPKREKCRELLAYKGELVNSLERITGVVEADVVLTIPDKEEYVEEGKEPSRPTASVVLRVKTGPNRELPIKEEAVQQFVSNAVPSMDPRDVSVILSPTSSWDEVTATTATDQKTPPPVTVKSKVENGEEEGVFEDETENPAAQRDDPASYTTIMGIEVRGESASQLKKLGLIALLVFLLMSALLVLVLVIQMRNKKRGTPSQREGIPSDAELLGATGGEGDRLLSAPGQE